jgi:hypothetical protein
MDSGESPEDQFEQRAAAIMAVGQDLTAPERAAVLDHASALQDRRGRHERKTLP